MEVVIGIIVVVLLILVSIKVVKFFIRLLLWGLALLILVGTLSFFLPANKTPNNTKERPAATEKTKSTKEKR